MKKALTKILGMGLAVCLLFSSFAGCSSAGWKGSSISDWGNVVKESLGGFMAETENYYFYINGIGSVSGDNTLGAPTKGALYAVKKGDLTTNVVTVPKLFSTTDYEQGLYLNGDYVYYGTNSTEKDSNGDIAYGEMTFTRSKLNGTENTALFTVDSLSVQHRFVEKDGKVFIVYFDSTDNAIISYDTSAKESKTIAQKDEEAFPETLDACTFTDKVGADGLVLAYTTTVYTEEYNKDRLEDTEGTRGTESYNNLYALVEGESEAKVIYEGKTKGEKFAITMIKGGYVYYTKTVGGTTKTYAVTTADFMQKKEGVEVVADYVSKTNLIVSLDEVYTVSEGKVYKDTLIKANISNASKVLVAKNENISTLLFIDGENLYFYDASNYIARVELGKEDAEIIKVSDNAVATTWHAPEIVNFEGEKSLFYVDSSSYGLSYIKYVNLTTEKVAEDTDDDGEDDKFYLEGHEFLSVLSAEDKAKIFDANVSNLDTKLDNGKIVFTEVEGALTAPEIEKYIKDYSELIADVKDLVSESSVEKLENMEKAIKIANLLNKLDGIYKIDMLGEAEKAAFKSAYETIKGEMEAFYAGDDKDAVIAYIDTNLLYNYQRATAEFAE